MGCISPIRFGHAIPVQRHKGAGVAGEPPCCNWGAPGVDASAHYMYAETGKGVKQTCSPFLSLTVLEHLIGKPLFPTSRNITH